MTNDISNDDYDFGDDADVIPPSDPQFDAWLAQVAPGLNEPGLTPRAEMWRAIRSAQSATGEAHTGAVAGVLPMRRNPWRLMLVTIRWSKIPGCPVVPMRTVGFTASTGIGLPIFFFAMSPAHAAETVHSRMFAPGLGVPEDPATGSAAAALAGMLAHTGDLPSERAKGKYGAETTPLKVGDTLYLCSAKNILIALDPATTEIYADGAYTLAGENRTLSPDDMVAFEPASSVPATVPSGVSAQRSE